MAPHNIDNAFILAAGYGTRLRPFTETRPKPMIEVAGRTLIDHTLDHLQDAGIQRVVVNTHYRAAQLAEHLRKRPRPSIHISHEEELLDTGGGIVRALDYFNDMPFFVMSGDGFWSDGPGQSALRKLAESWDPGLMDILILLQPVKNMNLTQGTGDYDILAGGRARRSLDRTGTHMFTSIRINSPRIFENRRAEPFSYLELLDEAEKRGRLYAIEHTGAWHHISTPADLKAVRAAYEDQKEAL